MLTLTRNARLRPQTKQLSPSNRYALSVWVYATGFTNVSGGATVLSSLAGAAPTPLHGACHPGDKHGSSPADQAPDVCRILLEFDPSPVLADQRHLPPCAATA